MASIRQGTEFAIAQLEEVYRLRRRADREIAALDARLATLRKGSAAGGSVVRVWLDAPRGAASVSWSVAGGGWRPRYEFRFDGTGTVQVGLRAGLPPGASGPVSVAESPMNGAAAEAVHPVTGDFGVVESFRLPASREQLSMTPLTTLHASVVNTTGRPLPAGDADGYWQGEYLGTLRLSVIPSGEGVELRFGTLSHDSR
jgi:hypothetical protein